MNLRTILIIAFIVALLFIIHGHYNKFIKKSKKELIEQDDHYNETVFEKNHEHNKHIYITRFYSTQADNNKIFELIQNCQLRFYSKVNNKEYLTITLNKLLSKNDFKKEFKPYLLNKINVNIPIKNNIFSDLSINKERCLTILAKNNTFQSFYTSHYDKFCIHVVKGSISCTLYHPKYLLKIHNKKDITLSNNSNDIYSVDIKEKTNKTKIILREGNLVYIPNFWIFQLDSIEDSILMSYSSNTIISRIYNIMN